jgi:hypothetical protein
MDWLKAMVEKTFSQNKKKQDLFVKICYEYGRFMLGQKNVSKGGRHHGTH